MWRTIKITATKHKAEVLLAAMVLGYTAVMSILAILRHNSFASNYDLANSDQTIWNTLHGHFFELSGNTGLVSRFQFHADLVLMLIAPFYLIYDNVKTLLVVQSAGIALAAIPVYFLAKAVLKSKAKGLIMAAVFLLNPAVEWANIYDFHGVTLAMLFLLCTFLAAYKKRWGWMYAFMVLSLLTKEEVSLFLLMIGLYLIFIVKEKAQGIRMAAISGVWFLITVFLIIPSQSVNGQFWVWEWYSFGHKSAVRTSVWGLASKLVNGEAWSYYWDLLKPFGLIPLFGLPWVLLAAPELGINLLSNQGQMRSYMYHYQSVVLVGLVIATIFGWQFLERKWQNYKFCGRVIGAILLLAALRVNYHYSPLPTTPSFWKYIYQVSDEDRQFEKLLATIPKEASVTASSEVRTHLTHRVNAYNLPNMVGQTDYIALIDQDRIVGDFEPKQYETQLIGQLAQDKNYNLEAHIGHFYLYKRVTDKVAD